jgi:hypothetical protein
MAKQDRKTRGRTAISGQNVDTFSKSKTKPNVEQVLRREATRPQGPGGGKHRGDRRDMNKAYTGNAKHAARGNTPRKNVATRKD